MNDNNDFDRLLNERKIPEPASNLAHRIIAAAEQQINELPLYQKLINEVSQMIYVPRPAYAFAVMLIIGIFAGLQINGESALIDLSEELFSFTQIEQEEWL